MVRYKKIKTAIVPAVLAALLLVAGCSSPKQSGVALYLPKYDYRHHPADTILLGSAGNTVALENYIKADKTPMDTVIFDNETAKTNNVVLADTIVLQSKYDSIATESKRVVLSEKMDTLTRVNNQAISSDIRVADSLTTSRFPIKQDSVFAERNNTAVQAASVDTVIIKEPKTQLVQTASADTLVSTRSEKTVSESVKAVDESVVDTLALQNNKENVSDIQLAEKKNASGLKENIEKDLPKTSLTQSTSKTDSAQLSTLDTVKVFADYARVSTENYIQKEPDNQQGVTIRSGKQYLAAATEQPKDYLAERQLDAANVREPDASEREKAALQSRVNELTRQNQQLQRALYSPNANASSGAPMQQYRGAPQQDNSRLLSELSNAVVVMSGILAMNAAQSKSAEPAVTEVVVRDTILKQDTVVIRETVSVPVITENPQLIAQNDALRDSLTRVQNKLFDKNLKDSERKPTEEKPEIPVVLTNNKFTAYYAPGKIVSKNEQQIIRELKAKIPVKKVSRISLIGYTDSSGSPQLNLELSNKRGVRLVNELVKLGFNREYIFLQYFGSQHASDKVVDEERRVEIIVETVEVVK